jgi:predicted  nucleic acid-binding Zn-ribbon protein
MSKICENCGNMIPDGTDICPSCGHEDYDADALQEMLSQWDVPMDAEEENEPETPDLDDTQMYRPDEIQAETERRKVRSENSRDRKKTSAATASSTNAKKKRKKKKKKKNSSKAAIGVVIGMIVALALIFAGALFMLYQMGFFVEMTDDELLQTVTVAPVETAEPVQESPEVSEEPSPEVSEEPSPEVSEEPSPEVSEEVECTKFTITGAEYLTLYSRGETAEVVFVIEPQEARNSIEWESSDETVATVSNLGVIAARRGGTCTITGTCGDKSITVNVTCQFTVPSTVLDMNYSDITMDHEGQTLQLNIDYDLTDEQIAATVWETSDETIATVDESGLVTAIADGTAVISASIGDYTASCIVRCVNVTGNKGYNSDDSEYVTNYEDVTLTRKGEYFQLNLTSILGNVVPDYTWQSSDTSVATVDSKGIVTAVKNGTTNITTSVAGYDFRCIVRVNISSD